MCTLFSGAITISGNMTFSVDSDLNGASPQFTLTCISTGGPATTVTWTRDSSPASGNQSTQFNGDTTAPQYTHTLTVTGGSGMRGLYTCTVANNRPSSASVQLIVQGMQWKCTVMLCMRFFICAYIVYANGFLIILQLPQLSLT